VGNILEWYRLDALLCVLPLHQRLVRGNVGGPAIFCNADLVKMGQFRIAVCSEIVIVCAMFGLGRVVGLYCTGQCAVLCRSVLRSAVNFVVLCCAVLFCVALCCEFCCAVLCCAVLCCAVL
jgi:hypothetical protein